MILRTERWPFRASSFFSPDGRRLVLRGDRSFTILPFDVRKPTVGEVIVDFSPSRDSAGRPIPIGTAAFSPNGSKLVTSDALGEIILWDFVTLRKLYQTREAIRQLAQQQLRSFLDDEGNVEDLNVYQQD